MWHGIAVMPVFGQGDRMAPTGAMRNPEA